MKKNDICSLFLDELSTLLEERAAGNLDARLNMNRADGMSELASKFNIMADSISDRIVALNVKVEDKMSDLYELNMELEESEYQVQLINNSLVTAVEEKTQKLLIANEELEKSQLQLKKHNESQALQIELKTLELQDLAVNLEKRVKEELENSRIKDQQMLEQSRLAQMGEMISMIAHQWRQPLTAISSTSAAIGLKAQLDVLEHDEAIELSGKISQYSQHLSSTIDDFREFFKTNKEKKWVTYEKILDEVLSIIETSISNKNIGLIKDFKCHKSFQTYQNELKQVILNLIKNAEDILMEKKIDSPFIHISTYIENDTYILEVSDNGGGVPEEIIGKIFDPYFSTKKKKDGTGLGLYMSKTIIEDHCKGTINATNIDDGTSFKITLNIEKE